MRHNIIFGFFVLILILFVLSLCSCSPSRRLNKAKGEFGRAVTSFPEIGAEYCAITYPVKTIHGKDSITVDTLWGSGETVFDTVYSHSKDTVYVTRFIRGNTIRETITRIDTVVNTAEIAACRLQQGKIVDLLTDKTAEELKWRKKAKNRFWVIAGMGGAIGLWLFLFIRKKIKPSGVLSHTDNGITSATA